MLDKQQRQERYLAQTGRRELTPAQRRRVNRKRNHQSPQAADRREREAFSRRFVAARLKASRLGGQVSASIP
jgi:hypothetical protein